MRFLKLVCRVGLFACHRKVLKQEWLLITQLRQCADIGMGVQGLEQSVAVMRLGLKLAFNPRRCSLHFQLNAANPEHADIAKKLVDMAQKVAPFGFETYVYMPTPLSNPSLPLRPLLMYV